MLSLVIPVRDLPADQLDACVESFLRTKSKSLDDIVVIDFGSVDPVEYSPSDKRVRVVRVEAKHWNLAEALNAGVVASRNPVVAKVDAAVVIAAESGPSLDALADACRRNGDIAAIQTIDLPDGVDAKAALSLPTADLALLGRSRGRGAGSALVIFPVAIWDHVGGFDTRCEGWEETEIDFAGRVRRGGHKMLRVPSDRMRVFHVGPASRDSIADPARPKDHEAVSRDRSTHRSTKLPPSQAGRMASPNVISTPQPLVTIAIASTARNARDWILAGAIRSFVGQIDNDFEILVANLGPVDEVAARLRAAIGSVADELTIRAFDVGDAPGPAARTRLTDDARGR